MGHSEIERYGSRRDREVWVTQRWRGMGHSEIERYGSLRDREVWVTQR